MAVYLLLFSGSFFVLFGLIFDFPPWISILSKTRRLAIRYISCRCVYYRELFERIFERVLTLVAKILLENVVYNNRERTLASQSIEYITRLPF